MSKETLYNVVCINCDSVFFIQLHFRSCISYLNFQPLPKSSLWWQAKKYAELYLDALPISGEECGCLKKVREPNAPYCVFGFDDMCRDFDAPFTSFTKAVGMYLRLAREGMNIVFINGVSPSVEEKLHLI